MYVLLTLNCCGRYNGLLLRIEKIKLKNWEDRDTYRKKTVITVQTRTEHAY